jgi:hypothetical protein
MDAGINNMIYMELHLGPRMVNGTCGKMIVAGTIDRGSTVYVLVLWEFFGFLSIFTYLSGSMFGELS